MIFYDRVSIVCKTKVGSSPVSETFNGIVPAIVTPIESAKVIGVSGNAVTVTRYLFVIKPFAFLIPLNTSASAPSVAGANQIIFTYNGDTALSLENKVERHLYRGRLHHYEAVVKST